MDTTILTEPAVRVETCTEFVVVSFWQPRAVRVTLGDCRKASSLIGYPKRAAEA